MMDGAGQISAAAGASSKDSAARSAEAAKKKELEDKKLRKACAGFEAFFIYYMLKTMRETVPKSGLLGNSAGQDSYMMMMDQKIAESAAKRGDGLGLQKMLLDQMTKNRSIK